MASQGSGPSDVLEPAVGAPVAWVGSAVAGSAASSGEPEGGGDVTSGESSEDGGAEEPATATNAPTGWFVGAGRVTPTSRFVSRSAAS